ncbi:D-galactarate dehydratase [Rhodovulum steppense]|uniref:D-galactarate dehydratase n=1 Tax=Rhodovulum steppense TaxID=540251 RepID=A0A4R1YVS3_9RHOB|nr:D-galactarate dehydratase [Rhodovulum steppense]TCM85241.1 hypothetical protein EV216_10892 [Rhodovulum steppense]
MRRTAGLCLVLALGACAAVPKGGPEPAPAEPAVPVAAVRPPPPQARTAEEFDTTTPAQREAARAAPRGGDARLGLSVASLGDPTDPGFWAVTPLVTRVRPGRLVDPVTGISVQVELRPRDAAPGAGTLVSLPTMRALGVPLTALREIAIHAAQ